MVRLIGGFLSIVSGIEISPEMVLFSFGASGSLQAATTGELLLISITFDILSHVLRQIS